MNTVVDFLIWYTYNVTVYMKFIARLKKKILEHFRWVAGFGLVESIVGVAIFAIIGVSVYSTYVRIFQVIRATKEKDAAIALANEEFEVVRNLPYSDVGIMNGIPPGKIPATQVFQRAEWRYTVSTVIRNIDDLFDGTAGGTPNDLSPADYKLAELTITCTSCQRFTPIGFNTRVSPQNLESASTNGSLFVQVFDANGNAVKDATVHIVNSSSSIDITDVTDNTGWLRIIDAPPGVNVYQITVSKNGYSTEQTYTPGSPQNPNPIKPHATVAVQEVTQTSFAIDGLSTLNVSSVTESCSAVGPLNFHLKGSKLIGTSPDVYKYDENPYVTDSSGIKVIPDLEWDTLTITSTNAAYDLAGTIPLSPMGLAPSTTQNLMLVVADKDPQAIMVTVRDLGTQLPISGAEVTLTKSGYSGTATTGRGFLTQTDWSNGPGNATSTVDPKAYFFGDSTLDDQSSPPGDLTLKKIGQFYQPSGTLISSTFDTGSAGNFYQLLWNPGSEPPQTGADSIKFQFAANNDASTWNFTGPDGTADTYYTYEDQNLSNAYNNKRYARYKAFLQTASTSYTPTLSDVSFTFSSQCVPSGQVLFNGLSPATYSLTVTKSGYQSYTDSDVSINGGWQAYDVSLQP